MSVSVYACICVYACVCVCVCVCSTNHSANMVLVISFKVLVLKPFTKVFPVKSVRKNGRRKDSHGVKFRSL